MSGRDSSMTGSEQVMSGFQVRRDPEAALTGWSDAARPTSGSQGGWKSNCRRLRASLQRCEGKLSETGGRGEHIEGAFHDRPIHETAKFLMVMLGSRLQEPLCQAPSMPAQGWGIRGQDECSGSPHPHPGRREMIGEPSKRRPDSFGFTGRHTCRSAIKVRRRVQARSGQRRLRRAA